MNDHQSTIAQIAQWLAAAKTAVAFTGAGVSTESGVPDFRSPGGIWATSKPVYFDEFLASSAARHEYWRQKCAAHGDFAAARPNTGHQALARWELAGRIRGVITQNIDGLHQEAGCRNVLELHGTARKIVCLQCETFFEVEPLVEYFQTNNAVPNCRECGGLIKHATISFGQMLPAAVLEEADLWSREADLLLAMGSSLVVTPAALLPQQTKRHGGRLVIINRDETPLDGMADAVVRGSIGEALTAIDAALADV